MKVKALNSNVAGYKRLAYGRLIDELDVDLTQDISKIKKNLEFALETWLEINQQDKEFAKLLKKVDQDNIAIHEGGRSLDIIESGVGSLGWFSVEDHQIF